MKVFNDLKNIPADIKNAVVAIGNFDGVHRGHQMILERAKKIAASQGKPFGVLTFEPHPRRLFRPDDPPFRLTPFALKMDRLRVQGLDFVCSLDFDWDFASQSSDDFIEEVVRAGLSPSHIIVGYDFCFGQLRKGAPEDFKAAGFETTIIEEIAEAGEKLSSSAVIRPMFEVPVAQVESFIFDFDEEIYGKILRVRPIKRLRGEAKFESLDDLITQMGKDCAQAREILERL